MSGSQASFFESSNGSVIAIKRMRISRAALVLAIKESLPRPVAPFQTVRMGGRSVKERNIYDPHYISEVQEWDGELNRRVTMAMLKKGTMISLSDEQMQEVAELREEEGDFLPLDNLSDEMVWLLFIAITTDDDTSALIQAMIKLEYPTAEAIEEEKATFPNPV